MKRSLLLSGTALLLASLAQAGQAPYDAGATDFPISDVDRVYAAEQYSNTVSVIDPSSNTLLGVIRLGDTQPANLSPLYKGQVLTHGLGFSPDRRTLAVVSIASNAVSFIETETNKVVHTTYVGRSPHEAFFTPDGKEVWVSVRGENYIAILDAETYAEVDRITVPDGPGMTIFSPDGTYAYICSSFTPETVVVETASRDIIGRIAQASPFCPNIAASPDGEQVWLTLKDVGKTMAFAAKPPFKVLRVLDTGPITNHVNFARTKDGQFAYVTIGGLNQVKVFRTDTFEQTATIPVGALPHGIWPSGDGTRMYVGLENGDAVSAIDTATNAVVATIHTGQAAQALLYVPEAVQTPQSGTENLAALDVAGQATHFTLAGREPGPQTSVAVFDQGITQILQAGVAGLQPKTAYQLALTANPDGTGEIETLARFQTNPAGAQVVTAVGPIRQILSPDSGQATPRRFLAIFADGPGTPAGAVQLQISSEAR